MGDKVPSSYAGVRAAQLNRQTPMKRCAVLLLVSAFMAASGAGEPKPADWSKLRERDKGAFPLVLDQLTVSELLILDPFATWADPPSNKPQFHKWVVASRGSPATVASGRSLILSMRAIVDHPDDFASACFEPHHALVLTDGSRRFDVVMCFKCSQYKVYDVEGRLVWGGSFTTVRGKEEARWNAVFSGAKFHGAN